MRRIIYAVIIAILFTACTTNDRANVSTGSWENVALVSKQRLIIEQQQQRFDDMERVIGEVQSDLGQAIDNVVAGLDGNSDLKSQFAIIDRFIRSVIESKRRLEELQSADWTEDAGAR
jgi:hypothetical protein